MKKIRLYVEPLKTLKWWKEFFSLKPLLTWKWWRQFIVYLVVSMGGMSCTRYVPDAYLPHWVIFSLWLGHLFNRKNYK